MNHNTIPPYAVFGTVSATPYRYYGVVSGTPYLSCWNKDLRNPLPGAVEHVRSTHSVKVPGMPSVMAGGAISIPRSKIVYPQRGGALGIPSSKINVFGGRLIGHHRKRHHARF